MRPHYPEWLELADAGLLQKVWFVHLDWPGGAVRVHSYIGDIEVNGEIWSGVGVIGTAESNGAETIAQKPIVTLKLSRLPESIAGDMDPEGAQGANADIYVGVKNPDYDDLRLIRGVVPEIIGRIGQVRMSFKDANEFGERVFDYTLDIEVGRSPRMPLTHFHSDADQRRITANHPGGPDTIFRHAAAAESSPPVWTPA